jgi:spermidine synthase
MHKTNILRLIITVLVAGFGGIVAQTILLRELLILFSGNELSIGVIIGSWVIWEAIGAFIGGKFNRKNNPDFFILSIILFSIFFPASIYLTRIFKVLLSIPPGVGVGLLPILYSSFIILLPTGILHGLSFTLACSIHNQLTGKGASSTGRVYFYEMLGTIAGGVLVSYLFIPYFNSFQIALAVAFTGAVACLVYMYPTGAHSTKGEAGYPLAGVPLMAGIRRGLFSFAAVLSVSAIIALTFNFADKIHTASIKKQWPQQNVVYYENSFYQNIVVIHNENQYTFFADGIPVITTPVPDITFVEEFAHFPLLAHPDPENVLILGGGAGGLINEILKYPVIQKIDYVEIDPLLLKTIKRFPTPVTQEELDNRSVKTHYTDGKIFLKETKTRYDAIFIGLPPPYTLRMNRFYTQEFFNMAKSILKTDGILALTMPGSLAYYNNELKELNVSIFQTLKSVFPHVFVLPGDFNLFIASSSGWVENMSPALLFNSLTKQKIGTNLITLPHINYRFDKKQQEWFFSTIKDTKASINKDFSPKGLYYNIAYQNLLFSPSLKFVFDSLKHLNILSALALVTAIFFVFLLLQKKFRHIGIPYAIATTGFTVMLFELILIFSFQIFYGYVFYEIGILITVFMAGMASGSFGVSYFSSRFNSRELSVFKVTEISILVFSLLLFFIFYCFGYMTFPNTLVIRIIFYCLLFVAGLFAGIEFPLSNKIFFRGSVANTAGILYSADLLGGWIGGIAGGLILLPVLGLLTGCLLLAALKLSSLILLLTCPEK